MSASEGNADIGYVRLPPMIELAKVAVGFCVVLAFSCVMTDDGRSVYVGLVVLRRSLLPDEITTFILLFDLT
jgi:hypothetical protein